MARAKKCDACGKFYEESKFIWSSNLTPSNNHHILEMIRVYDQIGNVVGSYDLCDDCAEKFDRFLNGKCMLEKESED